MKEWVANNKKNIICILLVIIIILISLIILNAINHKIKTPKDEDVEDGPAIEQEDYMNEWKGKIKDVDGFGDYYILKNAINKFYLNYAYLYTEDNSDYYYSNVLLNLLPKSYIEENNITKENIKDKFIEITESEIYTLSAYEVTNFEKEKVFFVDCLVRGLNSMECIENKLIVLCNTENQTFCIYPNDYVEKINLPELIVGEDYSIDFDVNFNSNNDNTYGSGNKTISDYVADVFETYRKLMLFAPEKAYELLDNGQKQETYSNYEIFKKFIDDNRTDIFLMTFIDYDVSIVEDYAIYTAYDKNDKFSLTFGSKSLTNNKFRIEKYI